MFRYILFFCQNCQVKPVKSHQSRCNDMYVDVAVFIHNKTSCSFKLLFVFLKTPGARLRNYKMNAVGPTSRQSFIIFVFNLQGRRNKINISR